MVTPLQLAQSVTTIGGYGIYRPLSITKIDRLYPANIFLATVRTVVHMMEKKALWRFAGRRRRERQLKATVSRLKPVRRKVGPVGRYISKYIAYTAPASRKPRCAGGCHQRSQAGANTTAAPFPPVFGAIAGGVLRTMNIEPDALRQQSEK